MRPAGSGGNGALYRSYIHGRTWWLILGLDGVMTMLTWPELEAQFREMAHPFRFVRIDVQWGSSGEHWRLAGEHDATLSRRFESLAAVGGRKLQSVLPDDSEVLAPRTEPTIVWYRALWRLGGYLQQQSYTTEQDEEGNIVDTIYLGSIERPAETSAVFCLDAGGTYGEVPPAGQSQFSISAPAARTEEVLELKPNFFGLGLNLRALWRRVVPRVKGGRR